MANFVDCCVILIVMQNLRSEFFTFLKCKEFVYLSAEHLISISSMAEDMCNFP